MPPSFNLGRLKNSKVKSQKVKPQLKIKNFLKAFAFKFWVVVLRFTF
jgi:hypothetical protein